MEGVATQNIDKSFFTCKASYYNIRWYLPSVTFLDDEGDTDIPAESHMFALKRHSFLITTLIVNIHLMPSLLHELLISANCDHFTHWDVYQYTYIITNPEFSLRSLAFKLLLLINLHVRSLPFSLTPTSLYESKQLRSYILSHIRTEVIKLSCFKSKWSGFKFMWSIGFSS